jgi:haloalkane dehalogenase
MKLTAYDKSLYPFESKWIKIKGSKIHYIDEGQGDIILFVHPPMTSSFMYRNMIEVLKQNFRCLAFDFPAFGLSEPSSAYHNSIDSQSEIVEEFLKLLNLQNINFVMQECGGHAAMKVFLKNPSILKSVILTDTIIFPVSQYPKIKRMLNFVNGGIFNFLNSNFNFLARAMTKFGIQKRKLSKAERDTYKAIFHSKELRQTTTAMLQELVKQEKLLSEIENGFKTVFNKLPILIIYGDKDPLTGFGVPQKINQLLPNSELHWIKGEGHFPHEGAPGEMSEIMKRWLLKTA